MISVKELRALGTSLPLDAFRRQLGPFALIQRPPTEDPTAGAITTRVANPKVIEQGIVSLLFEFDELIVALLPPLEATDALSIGRITGNELVVEDGSVSKQHARLQWNQAERRCTVKDQGSRNGTFLNGTLIMDREVTLRDGDILSFGHVQFWFLLTETLHARLRGELAGGRPK
ncbi:FHA domain-containing protein [Stigmatella erecta]|uniref:FHA domain-containing protein n=1 Tax=Stigmatella erecta TaxID=83460 RepID=A0A1I0AV83_9BACT|nr:FHA domain-containing protein [Stigmatella erecta]SES98317.1 FHA domain-containing protein [Stigmatella erecta]